MKCQSFLTSYMQNFMFDTAWVVCKRAVLK